MDPLTHSPLPHPKLPFGQTYEFSLPGAVQADGREKIQTLIAETFGVGPLPDDWPWEWEVAKGAGKYIGKFPARVKQWLWKERQVKATKDVQLKLSVLGETIQRLYPAAQVFHYDLTDKLVWPKGQFGDSDSCYMTYNKRGADSLAAGGGGAMRRWTIAPDGTRQPAGRAWVVPCAYGYLLVNPRDLKFGKDHLPVMAEALTAWLNIPALGKYEHIIYNRLTDYNYYGGSFYTDSDPTKQWLLALSPELLKAGQADPCILMNLPQEGETAYQWYLGAAETEAV